MTALKTWSLKVGSPRFDKIVSHKINSGSRKCRQDLLQETIYRHNKQAVGKAKINTNEIAALYFFDEAPLNLRRALKLIWGTEAPAQTAAPLSLVGQPFLIPKKSLSGKFSAQSNPLWHEISKHSWDKVAEFLKRLETKWNAKLQEYYDRGQAPPIYQPQVCGQFRDSGREAEVMLMASFMVHFKSDLEKLLGEGGFCKLQHTWRTGHFDSKLLPEIQACRPDFKLADLGFTPEGTADQAALPEAFDMDEEEQANLRVLIGLARGLRKEQDAMRAHRAAATRHQTATLAADSEWQQHLAAAVKDVWQEHGLYYQAQACKDLQACQSAESSVHQTLAARLLVGKSNVPIITFVNVPMLGAQASTLVRNTVAHMSAELASNPEISMCVVLPPNQPEHGQGHGTKNAGKALREESVARHQALWRAELETCESIKAFRCTALFNEQTMYSDERDLGLQVWVVVSATVADNLQAKNIFGSSTLLKRKAVPGLLNVMQRVDMLNFWKDLAFAQTGQTNRDADAERRQHYSGHAFFYDLLLTILSGTKLKTTNTVLIRDETLYDAELGKAVASLNSCKTGTAAGMKTWPDLAYIGLCWAPSATVKQIVAKNVQTMLEEHVQGAIARGEYALAKMPAGLQAPRPADKSQAPQLDMSVFELTVPQTTNLELPFLKTTMDKGQACSKTSLPSSEVWSGLAWADIVKQHNDEFNPAGTVRNKREADIPVEQLLG